MEFDVLRSTISQMIVLCSCNKVEKHSVFIFKVSQTHSKKLSYINITVSYNYVITSF